MKKSMYSLMLSENVVAAVDELAYRSGTNRSAMVNSILAQYVSYRTPEMRIRELFGRMESLLEPCRELMVSLRPSDTQMALRSALSYKYNPTVHYSVELYRSGSELGELRASLRTRNSALIEAIQRFFLLWSTLEGPGGGCSVSGERFVKKLQPRAAHGGTIDEESLGDAIVEYIRAFDRALKEFFRAPEEPDRSTPLVRAVYDEYRRNADILL